jgi:phosphoglycolate phosphatase-like HAD superfamily hydrolase
MIIVGAKTHGVFSIGVLWGYESYDEFVTAGAIVLCETPAMLDRILSFRSSLNPVSSSESI